MSTRSTVQKEKKTLATRQKSHDYPLSLSFFDRYIHSILIYTYIYIYILRLYVSLHLSLLSHPTDYIRLYRAPQYNPKNLFSRNDNKNWTRLDFARISGNATRKMKNWREKIGGKFASRHLGSNSRRGVEKLGSVFSKGERKTFSRWLVEPWRESDAAFREGGRT